jgi:hypothetical protein
MSDTDLRHVPHKLKEVKLTYDYDAARLCRWLHHRELISLKGAKLRAQGLLWATRFAEIYESLEVHVDDNTKANDAYDQMRSQPSWILNEDLEYLARQNLHAHRERRGWSCQRADLLAEAERRYRALWTVEKGDADGATEATS